MNTNICIVVTIQANMNMEQISSIHTWLWPQDLGRLNGTTGSQTLFI